MNDPSPFTLLAFTLGVAKRRGIRLDENFRHVQPERLSLAFHRQPYVLPAVVAGLAPRADRSRRVLPGARCRTGIRFPSSASTCSRRARRRPRRWASRSRPRCNTPRIASRAAWTSTSCCAASPSSSTSRSASSRRSPNSAPARRIWARLARERLGAKNPNSWRFKFHGQTSGVDLTRQQPLNNIARVATQAIAGILSGLQSCTPTPMTRRWRRRPRRPRASRSRRRTSCARRRISAT